MQDVTVYTPPKAGNKRTDQQLLFPVCNFQMHPKSKSATLQYPICMQSQKMQELLSILQVTVIIRNKLKCLSWLAPVFQKRAVLHRIRSLAVKQYSGLPAVVPQYILHTITVPFAINKTYVLLMGPGGIFILLPFCAFLSLNLLVSMYIVYTSIMAK